jgi:hypothetical protein
VRRPPSLASARSDVLAIRAPALRHRRRLALDEQLVAATEGEHESSDDQHLAWIGEQRLLLERRFIFRERQAEPAAFPGRESFRRPQLGSGAGVRAERPLPVVNQHVEDPRPRRDTAAGKSLDGVASEDVCRAVIGMLVLGVRQHDERGGEGRHDPLDLTAQVDAAIPNAADDLLRLRRTDAIRVRRLERPPGRHVSLGQPAQPVVREAEERDGGAIDAERRERIGRFVLA